jgi:hypothetical protein
MMNVNMNISNVSFVIAVKLKPNCDLAWPSWYFVTFCKNIFTKVVYFRKLGSIVVSCCSSQ